MYHFDVKLVNCITYTLATNEQRQQQTNNSIEKLASREMKIVPGMRPTHTHTQQQHPIHNLRVMTEEAFKKYASKFNILKRFGAAMHHLQLWTLFSVSLCFELCSEFYLPICFGIFMLVVVSLHYSFVASFTFSQSGA